MNYENFLLWLELEGVASAVDVLLLVAIQRKKYFRKYDKSYLEFGFAWRGSESEPKPRTAPRFTKPPIKLSTGSFPGITGGQSVVPTTPSHSSAEVMESMGLYLHASQVPSWKFISNLSLHCCVQLADDGTVVINVVETVWKRETALSLWFVVGSGIAPIEIYHQLCQVYGPNVMCKQLVRCCCRQISAGRQNGHDEERSGRLTIFTDDLVEQRTICLLMTLGP
ncbi:hypothetical protein ANN_20808 [Periplaneta americana]|uniref:Uncharacterized protein n=1 Tax=Periplaneta americana TaxID=6978 RepID=A0ABQ8SDM5_PERAM|nr:hypothetical protein ANN_20808 [Periplaneta americana]